MNDRVDFYRMHLSSLVDRQRASPKTGSFVIFEYAPDIFVQQICLLEKDHTGFMIDLPVQIIDKGRLRILQQYYRVQTSENASTRALISYQVCFNSNSSSANIQITAEAIDNIFLKVFNLGADYKVPSVKTEKTQVRRMEIALGENSMEGSAVSEPISFHRFGSFFVMLGGIFIAVGVLMITGDITGEATELQSKFLLAAGATTCIFGALFMHYGKRKQKA